MKSLPLMQKVSRLFHQKRMFWRILVLYLAGSILLLTIFFRRTDRLSDLAGHAGDDQPQQ